ncbi:Lysine decarboxylase family [hydrothermal vent metagenome]|uniref:Lysine decarboxylase family n=1 Tax=hydrothermal vent metagenome TaxID=652676 RepID=A0A3B1DIZ7_9ZZZZ
MSIDCWICVFAGSSSGLRDEYTLVAQQLGEEMAKRNYGLVYGGAKIGLMGEVATAILAKGGKAIGVIPEFLASKEVSHDQLTKLHVVSTMHERKQKMSELADGFVALPGGLGTLEEMAEILTWAQLGVHSKPCGLLNVCGYYDALITFLDHAISEQFMKPKDRNLILAEKTPALLFDQMAAYQPVEHKKWVDSSQT